MWSGLVRFCHSALMCLCLGSFRSLRREILNDAKVPYNCALTADAMVRGAALCVSVFCCLIASLQIRKRVEIVDGKDSLKFECKVYLPCCAVC